VNGNDWQEEIYQKVFYGIYCLVDENFKYVIALQNFNEKRSPGILWYKGILFSYGWD
jgi:hypothetical protein